MRIAMVYELFWPARGGIETWLYSVGKELVARGHGVDLITGCLPDTPPTEELVPGFVVRRIDLAGLLAGTYVPGHNNIFRQMVWIPTIAAWLLRHGRSYDIVHAHVQASLMGAALATRARRLVWTWHGTYRRVFYEMFSRGRAMLYDVAERVAMRVPCAGCITVDAYTTEIARRDIRGIRVRLIPIRNGIDCQMFRPAKVAKPAEWGEGFHLVAARRLVPKNGVQFLLSALPELVRERPDVRLILYGDGPMRRELVEQAGRLGLGDRVRFLGPVAYGEVPRIYNAADVVVVPSVMEACSLSVLEGMACARPVLTSRVGGVPEIAPDDCVVYADPGNVGSIARQLRRIVIEMSPAEREAMGRRAREAVVTKFTWARVTGEIEAFYRQMLAAPARPGHGRGRRLGA